MKVVTLGEIMLRLSTPNNSRFNQSQSFDVCYGGGEANVAISLANYGNDAYYVTKLPKNEIGGSALNALRRYGVKTDYISKELFDSCIRTGYLTEITETVKMAVNA